MTRYIDANELLRNTIYNVRHVPYITESDVTFAPTADVVEQSVVDQIRWERDTAIAQLAEIGKGFGEQMDDVVEVKHGKWIVDDDGNIECSVCGHHGVGDLYCERCGADMREETEDE